MRLITLEKVAVFAALPLEATHPARRSQLQSEADDNNKFQHNGAMHT